MRDQFKVAGWTDQEMYALSYNGLGGNNGSALFTPNPQRDQEHTDMGWDGQTRVTSNDINVSDLHAFILANRTGIVPQGAIIQPWGTLGGVEALNLWHHAGRGTNTRKDSSSNQA